MIGTLKKLLKDAGCTYVIYGSDNLSNVLADQTKISDTVGLIAQPNRLRLEIKANTIVEHPDPLLIQIFQQVPLEQTASRNEKVYRHTLDVCKRFISHLINSGMFSIHPNIVLMKIREPEYDANVLGWTMSTNMKPLSNELRYPC
ncbi:MAG: hypothetical protein WDA29_10480 [Flavobacteriaceae bacterium]